MRRRVHTVRPAGLGHFAGNAGAWSVARQPDEARDTAARDVAQPLAGMEQEQSVFLDRPAGGPAVLIAIHGRLGAAKTVPEKAVCVEPVALDVVVRLAVYLIVPGFGLHQYDGSAGAAELRRVGIGQHLNLANRADIHVLAILIFGAVVVVDAIDLERRGTGAGAVEYGIRTGGVSRIVRRANPRSVLEAGDLLDEADEIAAGQRRVVNLLLGESIFDVAL